MLPWYGCWQTGCRNSPGSVPGRGSGRVQDMKADIFAKQGREIVLKFPADAGMQANDEYTVFLIDGGRRFGVRHDRCSFRWNHGFNRHIIMHNNA